MAILKISDLALLQDDGVEGNYGTLLTSVRIVSVRSLGTHTIPKLFGFISVSP